MEYIESGFLKKLKDKSILLYLSSCEYTNELLQLPYDYIILNIKRFFTRLSPLMGEQCLYLTNRLFLRRRPVEKRLPFDAACFSDYWEVTTKWRWVHVHHTSLWDCKENIDGWIIPHYSPEVLHNYLPLYYPYRYLFQKQVAKEMFSWALENKPETIAAIPYSSDETLSKALLDRLYRGMILTRNAFIFII